MPEQQANRCQECNIEFQATRKDAKFCSPKCRKDNSRKRVTDNPNVTLKAPEPVTDNFEFKTKDTHSKSGYNENAQGKVITRIGKYWYDIPIAAIPILKKDWPEMPEYMNGREYFLWFKNEFDTKDGKPIIINPYSYQTPAPAIDPRVPPAGPPLQPPRCPDWRLCAAYFQ